MGWSVFFALLLDRYIGEPRRWHPLVGFGNLAGAVEKHLNRGHWLMLKGAVAWLLMVLPIPAVLWLLQENLQGIALWLFSMPVLYLTIGWQSLREHATAVCVAFDLGGIEAARQKVSLIVSRDTQAMNEAEVSRATLESVLENGSDAIFAPLFWFCLAGPAGAVLYRFANTLDAMWGYRNQRFQRFGTFSARADDVLNLIPARLTALCYALLGRTGAALDCWRRQASSCASPNGGPVMCSGAGALGVSLGGPTHYHGALQQRPLMGEGERAAMVDVKRGVTLVDRTVLLWAAVLLLGGSIC